MQRVYVRNHPIFNRGLVERDPSLINLPIPVPSVPLLSPVLSPIVGGSNGGTTSASSSPASPTPTSSGGSGGTGTGGTGTGGTGSGGTGTGGTGSGGTGSGSGNGGGSGNGSGSGSGGTSGNGNGNGGSGGGGTTGSSSTATGAPAPASSLIALASSPSPPLSAIPSSPNGSTLDSNGQVVPGAGVPQNIQGTPTISSLSSTGNPKASQSKGVADSSTYTGVGGSPSETPVSAAVTSHQLSSGVIAGIILVCLLFLIGLIVVLVRRRSIARRIERRKQWWIGKSGALSSFSIIGSIRDSQGEGPHISSRASARSSFATNFDQGLMFRIDSPTSHADANTTFGAFPEFPPMAEVRERTSILFSSAGAVARRESMNSMTSGGSDSDTQYLVVPNDPNSRGVSSPMSVRPFSPSESFAFPKPPPCTEGEKTSTFGSNSHGHTSPSSSAATLIQIHSPPPTFNSDLPPPIPATSYLLPPSAPLPSSVAIPNTSSNPFADPVKPESYELEIIRRPFTPSLDDEITVSINDKVRVMKVFDDGWAFVEKHGGSLDRKESGLIPVDCLREAGQALPAFLAKKRVSSYGADASQLADMLAVLAF